MNLTWLDFLWWKEGEEKKWKRCIFYKTISDWLFGAETIGSLTLYIKGDEELQLITIPESNWNFAKKNKRNAAVLSIQFSFSFSRFRDHHHYHNMIWQFYSLSSFLKHITISILIVCLSLSFSFQFHLIPIIPKI